jgi:predicted ATPase/DNA-binding SARP family transcriptional activator
MQTQLSTDEANRAAVARSLNHLPAPHTRFIGREREIAEVARLLMSARLLTLTGAGGCGKTRLALAVASSLVAFEHGIWFIDLSNLDDAALVPQATAMALGMPETRGRSLTETLSDYLHAKQLLLILDNCEHLLAACAELAQRVLEKCPDVRVLATSREPLNVPCEIVWLVPSLSLPGLDSPVPQARESEAMQLFAARAGEALPDFRIDDNNAATIAQICRRLDGIPLAIELAAARVKLLDIVQIADRLDDSLQLLTRGNRAAASRHQTLRAALDWSYRLLQPRERVLFRRLAVFAGGCTLEDIEAACTDDPLSSASTAAHEFLRAADMLDLLSNLVDKSLVTIAERDSGFAVRYRLLEPIRQFARDELRRSGAETIVRDRHLAYFVALAEQAEVQLKGDGQLLWLRRLEKEHDNLRVALAWGTQRTSHAVAGLRLAKALHLFWQRRGYWSEGRRWLAQAISNYDAHPESQSPGSNFYLARALVAQSWLAIYEMDYQNTPADLEQALALAQTSDDLVTVVYAQGLLALVNGYTGDTAASYRYAAASVETARRSNDRWSLAWATHIFGWHAFYHRRDVSAAHTALSESEALFRAVGDKRSIAVHVNLLGIIALDANNLDTARANYEEALEIARELRDGDLQIKELSNLAGLALYQGNTTRAKELFEEALTQQREWNSRPGIMSSLYGLGQAHILEDELDAAATLLREALPLALGQTRQTPQALIAVALSRIMAAHGRALQATRVLGAVEANLHLSTLKLIADDRVSIEQNSTAVRAALPPEEFERAFAVGRSLTLEQALQEMLQPERDSEEKTLAVMPAADRLRLCALGPARVFPDEQALTSWPYARVKELLFYLIAQPPRTKAQIGLALWPDASPAQLRNSLSTTFYHLRRALGHLDWIIFADDHYYFNRARAYWFDVEAFEANLAQAAQLQATAPEQAMAVLQAALDLYQGDFVEDLLEGDWFLLRREELRRKYLDALLQLGQLFFAREDYVRAAEMYRRAIEKDEVLEAAHRELMRCYARSGERGQALRHYQTLTHIMRDELDSPPAPESVALYERLRRGETV